MCIVCSYFPIIHIHITLFLLLGIVYLLTLKVQLFIPCFIDQLKPSIAFDMIKVLERVGVEVDYNPNQTCCGQPGYNAGYWDEAKSVGQKFLKEFDGENYIVTPSASCTGMVRSGYSHLFHNTASHNACRNVQKNIFELSEFLIDVLKIDDVGATFKTKATYHDSCSALRECNIHSQPRQLLSKVKGLELVELKDNTVCCGFGGTFAVKFEPISVAMGEQKINNAVDTGAEILISSDYSCLLHLEAYAKKHNSPIQCMHIAEVLAMQV